ncbi:MAG: lipid-binding SYLF domain-containing protein [Gemmataceae bacterium]|nr:lipid-binding SYLF domain-containing protein [Gemmataceae bacterium]
MKLPLLLSASIALVMLSAGAVRAGAREAATVDSAAEVLADLSAIPAKCIPPALLQDAQGIAIIPDVIKAGFVLGGRHGKGVLLVRQPDGSWSNPIFISLTGGSVGWQIGIQATDLVLVFKTRGGLERIMKGRGKLTLGADIAVAAGPVGRQAEAATDGQLKAEILSYSRSRGLFAGVSVEGAALLIDNEANEQFYWIRDITPGVILGLAPNQAPPAAQKLCAELTRLSRVAPPVAQPGMPLPAVPMPPAGNPPQWQPIMPPAQPVPPPPAANPPQFQPMAPPATPLPPPRPVPPQ